MGGATRIVVETVDLEPVLPTISVCRMPGFETSVGALNLSYTPQLKRFFGSHFSAQTEQFTRL